MRMVMAAVLCAVLTMEQVSAQQPAPDSGVKQQIAALSSRALVDVSMRAGGTLRGHIVSRSDADFVLKQEKGDRQTISYDQVLSVSQVRSGVRHTLLITAVVVGVAVVVVAIVLTVALKNAKY